MGSPGAFVHVTFVALGSEQLGISMLSAVLRRAGHTTSLAFNPALFDDRTFLDVQPLARALDRTDRVVDEIVASRPDLVAFSVLTPTYQWCLRVARLVKAELDVPVIFGGVHPSAVPEVCLENVAVDYVCVGEGERPMLSLCEVLPEATGRPKDPIPNLRWVDDGRLVVGPSAPFHADLDDLPYFEKDLWVPHLRIGDNWMTMAARGCPYRCTFCFNNFFAKLPGRGGGRYLRRRSVGHQIGELVDAKERFAIRRVEFQDDIFTTDKAWLEEFLDAYRREVDLPFQCLVHPRYIDVDMARWLVAAGCEHVQMGVQSADGEYKRTQLLRMEKEAHMESSLAALEAAGLDVKVDHMLGLPGEPLGAQEQARELYAAHVPRRIQTFWLTHLPGVELTRRAVADGHLSPEDYDRINRGESGRFHTRSEDHTPDAARYRRYELLFRLMPLLPERLARRLRIHHVPDLPPAAIRAVGVSLEVANAVVNRDSESRNYIWYYLHQFRRELPAIRRERQRRRRRARRPEPEVLLRTFEIPSPDEEPEATPLEPAGSGSTPVRLSARRERQA